MMLTWTPTPVPYDQAFEAIKAAIDAMPAGVKLFINSGMLVVYSPIPTYRCLKSAAHPIPRRILRPGSLGSELGPARCFLREVS